MAIRFDATGDVLTRDSALLGLNTAYTYMGLFRLESATGGLQTFFTLADFVATHYDFIGVLSSREFYMEANGGTYVPLSTGQIVPLSTWVHIAVVRNTVTPFFTLYYNGVSAGTITSNPGTGRNPPTINKIGAFNDANSNRLDGSVAYVKAWSAVLTAAEIAQEVQSARPVRTTNLHGWWPMRGVPADAVLDLSGNGRPWTANGTLTEVDGPPIAWGAAVILPEVVAAGEPEVLEGALQLVVTPTLAISATGIEVLDGAIALRESSRLSVLAQTIPSGAPLSNPQTINMGTAGPLEALSPDGFTWAQGYPLIVDAFGNMVATAQGNGRNTHLVWSSDGGTTWSASASFSTDWMRGAFVIVGDTLHAIWTKLDKTELYYRRYSITRDGSNLITGISYTGGETVTLDDAVTTIEHPVLLHLDDAGFGTNGALLACWGARNGSANEIRAVMCELGSGDTAGLTLSNWTHVGVASSTTIGSTPNTASYTALVANSTAGIALPSILRRPDSGDLVVVYHDGAAPGGVRWFRAPWDNVNLDWSETWTSPALIANEVRAGTDAGYGGKQEIVSKPVFDPGTGRVYVGFSTWKDNTAGDTWSFRPINDNDTLGTLVDVYEATAADSDANAFVTGDLAFDAQLNALVVAWTDLPLKHTYVAVYATDGTTQLQAPTLVSSARPWDIPTIWEGPRYTDGGIDKLLILVRDFNNEAQNQPPTYSPPYQGYLLTMDWVEVVSGQLALQVPAPRMTLAGTLGLDSGLALTNHDRMHVAGLADTAGAVVVQSIDHLTLDAQVQLASAIALITNPYLQIDVAAVIAGILQLRSDGRITIEVIPLLVGQFIADSSQIFSGTLTPESVTLSGQFLSDTSQVFGGTLSSDVANLSGQFLASNSSIFAGTLSPEAVNLVGQFLADASQVFAGSLFAPTGNLAGQFITISSTIWSGTLLPGTANMAGQFLGNTSVLYLGFFEGIILTPSFREGLVRQYRQQSGVMPVNRRGSGLVSTERDDSGLVD